jgi:Rap1a immunity proteins
MNRLLVLIVAAMMASPADALTGAELWKDCQEEKADFSSGLCMGYILGISVMLETLTAEYCRPAGSTNGQIVDVVKRHLEDHPHERHLSAADLITTALSENFPCPSNHVLRPLHQARRRWPG